MPPMEYEAERMHTVLLKKEAELIKLKQMQLDMQILQLKEEEGKGCQPKSSEPREAEMEDKEGTEASAVKLNFGNENNNEEHWEELQKLSQRELLDDPDFEPIKPKKQRKSAPSITPIAPAMLKNSAPDVSKKSSADVSKKFLSSSSKKSTRKSEKLTGEVDMVAETRCTRIPGIE